MQQEQLPGSPAAADAGDNRRFIRFAWMLIAGITLIRALHAMFYPLDLAGDEAYYWDWGRRLDWGYFSKPPLIAWLMRLVTEIGGSETVTIRIAAAVIGAGSLAFVLLLAKRLFGSRAAFWAVVISIAVPANAFLSTMLTIDAPLVFFWSASLFFFWRWHEGRTPVLSAACLAMTLGLGYLSKQMMLVFPVLAIVFLLLAPRSEERKPGLKRPTFWLAIAVSLAFLIPNLIWNAQNDWIMLAHTGGQISGEGDAEPFWLTFPAFVGSQAGMLSPVTWFLVVTAALFGLIGFRKLGERERFLILFSAPALVVMYGMSLGRAMLPNWPAVYYISAIVLLAGWFARAVNCPGLVNAWRKAVRPGIFIGLVMVVAIVVTPPLLDATGLAGHPLDPMRRLRGSSEVGEKAGEFFDKLPNPEKTFVLAQGHRYHASHLAFYLPGQPRVYRWERLDQIASQYEIWPNPIEDGKLGWDALVFVPGEERNVPFRLKGSFGSFDEIGQFAVMVGEHEKKFYRVFLGSEIKEWPVPMKLEKPAAE